MKIVAISTATYLVWGQDLTGDVLADTYRIAIGTEGGTWSTPTTAFEPDGDLSIAFDAAMDGHGHLHVMFDRSTGVLGKRRVQETVRDTNGNWSTPRTLFDLSSVSEGVNVSANKNGELFATVYATDAPGGAGIVTARFGPKPP